MRWRTGLVAGVVMAMAATGCRSDAPAPQVASMEAAAADGGVIAEREVDGVRVRARVEAGRLCLWVLTPGTPSSGGDPFDDGGGGCTDLAFARTILARHGISEVGTADSDWRVVAGVVPDGYDRADAPDGRRWDIVDNLLVIVEGPPERGGFAGWPEELQLRGPAGHRTIVINPPGQ